MVGLCRKSLKSNDIEPKKWSRNKLEYYYNTLKENQKGLCLEERSKRCERSKNSNRPPLYRGNEVDTRVKKVFKNMRLDE